MEPTNTTTTKRPRPTSNPVDGQVSKKPKVPSPEEAPGKRDSQVFDENKHTFRLVTSHIRLLNNIFSILPRVGDLHITIKQSHMSFAICQGPAKTLISLGADFFDHVDCAFEILFSLPISTFAKQLDFCRKFAATKLTFRNDRNQLVVEASREDRVHTHFVIAPSPEYPQDVLPQKPSYDVYFQLPSADLAKTILCMTEKFTVRVCDQSQGLVFRNESNISQGTITLKIPDSTWTMLQKFPRALAFTDRFSKLALKTATKAAGLSTLATVGLCPDQPLFIQYQITSKTSGPQLGNTSSITLLFEPSRKTPKKTDP